MGRRQIILCLETGWILEASKRLNLAWRVTDSAYFAPFELKIFCWIRSFPLGVDIVWFILILFCFFHSGLGKGGDCRGKEVTPIVPLKQHFAWTTPASRERCLVYAARLVCVSELWMPDTVISKEITQLTILADRRSSSVVLRHRRHSLRRTCGIITMLLWWRIAFPACRRHQRCLLSGHWNMNCIPGLKLNLPPWQIGCELNMIWATPVQPGSTSPLGALLIGRVSIRQLGKRVNVAEHMARLSPWW